MTVVPCRQQSFPKRKRQGIATASLIATVAGAASFAALVLAGLAATLGWKTTLVRVSIRHPQWLASTAPSMAPGISPELVLGTGTNQWHDGSDYLGPGWTGAGRDTTGEKDGDEIDVRGPSQHGLMSRSLTGFERNHATSVNLDGISIIDVEKSHVDHVEKSNTKGFRNRRDNGRCFTDPRSAGGTIQRCRANVYIFGVSKCGTTSFVHWMHMHPALRWVSNPSKLGQGGEAHVLDAPPAEWDKIVKAGRYGAWGVTAPEAQESHKIVDYTPHYVTMPEVPYRIAERYGSESFDGSVKYVVLLREPVSRVISSWQFKTHVSSVKNMKGTGKKTRGDNRSLEDVVVNGQREVDALLDCRRKAVQQLRFRAEGAGKFLGTHIRDLARIDLRWCNAANYFTPHLFLAHIGKSAYAMQLERWFALFGRENIKVVFLEEIVADPVGVLESVFDFLGLNLMGKNLEEVPTRQKWEVIVRSRHNQTDLKKKAVLSKQITPELLESMRTFYAPHNSALRELLGRPLPANWTTMEDLA